MMLANNLSSTIVELVKKQQYDDIYCILTNNNNNNANTYHTKNDTEGNSDYNDNYSGKTIYHMILTYDPPVKIVDLVFRSNLLMNNYKESKYYYKQIKSSPEMIIDIQGRTPLHDAVASGCSVSIITRLLNGPLSSTKPASTRDTMLRYPLHWACTNPKATSNNNNTNTNNINHNKSNTQQRVPGSKLVRKIFRNKSSPLIPLGSNSTNTNNNMNNKQKIRLGSSIDINDIDDGNYYKIVELLVRAYPKAVLARDYDGFTPLDIAMLSDVHQDIIHLLEITKYELTIKSKTLSSSTKQQSNNNNTVLLPELQVLLLPKDSNHNKTTLNTVSTTTESDTNSNSESEKEHEIIIVPKPKKKSTDTNNNNHNNKNNTKTRKETMKETSVRQSIAQQRQQHQLRSKANNEGLVGGEVVVELGGRAAAGTGGGVTAVKKVLATSRPQVYVPPMIPTQIISKNKNSNDNYSDNDSDDVSSIGSGGVSTYRRRQQTMTHSETNTTNNYYNCSHLLL